MTKKITFVSNSSSEKFSDIKKNMVSFSNSSAKRFNDLEDIINKLEIIAEENKSSNKKIKQMINSLKPELKNNRKTMEILENKISAITQIMDDKDSTISEKFKSSKQK